ncbi:MAG: ergothioneine biosynthesis protein EgtB [Candidatus Kapaibacterium sp.]|jgi:ergothioneine biosynthesis protein EgtB
MNLTSERIKVEGAAGRSVEPTTSNGAETSRANLLARYTQVRDRTIALCANLKPEDFVVQSMPDASPTKWHLAHTSWFFETFVLKQVLPDYRSPDDRYDFLFNSYYNTIGQRIARDKRGMLTRPTIEEVFAYRTHVNEQMHHVITQSTPEQFVEIANVIILGLQHEEQHEELLLTDIKHAFSQNPLQPSYALAPGVNNESWNRSESAWIEFSEGLYQIGANQGVSLSGEDFAFDNEGPRHRVFVDAFRLASRLVTVGEYLEFIKAGGYTHPEWWLSDGWYMVQSEGWRSPLYWQMDREGVWHHFTMQGLRPLDLAEPVTHISYYEADAFATWAGVRLPTEAEWEIASEHTAITGNFLESNAFHPQALTLGSQPDSSLLQMFGDVWQWTRSAYEPYSGFRIAPGAIGEYNGKFMSGQMVLRGGSCVTPRSHIRKSYRNFFPPSARWQFSGLRLAQDVR